MTCQVIGNWKMNGSREFATRFFAELKAQLQGVSAGVEVGICPPFTLLPQVASLVDGSRVRLGAQNVSSYAEGAHTGEISAVMLSECCVEQVIVGHSERRAMHGETSEMVAHKARAALVAGIQPIVCVGETKDERSAGRAETVVAEQLHAVQQELGDEITGCLIAYEPVWAIGTGDAATPEQAQDMHAFIRQVLGSVGRDVAIIYGGSVKAGNAAELFAKRDIQGGLIGGASLKTSEFVAICQAADQSLKG